MAIRLGAALLRGASEGIEQLSSERDQRMEMARKLALLNAEKKLIAQRDLLEHGYRMKELQLQYENRMKEIYLQNYYRQQPQQMSQEETDWWTARTAKENAEAARARQEKNKEDDTKRKELERDVDYLDKRLNEISYTTKGEMGDEPKRAVYGGHEMEYQKLARERDRKLVDLGRLTPDEFSGKWNITEKPNPVKLGLVPQGLIPRETTPGPAYNPPTGQGQDVGGAAGQGPKKPSFYELQ
jgi:hypothetical protein